VRIGEARTWLLAALLCCATGSIATPAAQAGFGVEEKNFEAGTCVVSSCTYASVEANHEEAYTQAAGHPPVGLTAFKLNAGGSNPQGTLKRVRVDVPPGLAADPEALEQCPVVEFEEGKCAASHPKSLVGENKLTAYVEALGTTLENSAPVYNLQQPPGLPLDFGIEVVQQPLLDEHIFLQGHVSWNTDYHEYFEINDITKEIEVEVLPSVKVKSRLAVLKSELIFNGRAGEGNFLTLPSVCSATTTSYLEVESWEGEVSKTQTHTPVGVEGCAGVPFKPTAEAHAETAKSDEPDGVTAEVKVPQNVGAEAIDTADIADAHLTLPEGLTLNPSAAHGLAACTEAQAGLQQISPGVRPTTPVTCPAASKVGSVSIETDLPPGSLAGDVYLGSPTGAPITGPPYTMYMDAESALGVAVRLQGQVTLNPSTGRLEASFAGNPQLPFSDLAMKFDGGPLAPLANPLSCAAGAVEALFTPYTGGAAAFSSTPFAATGCSSPLPFALSQSTHDTSPDAGAYTSYTFALARADGQQYLGGVKTTLPAGLLGMISTVALCAEAPANAGSCPAASEIGSASVSAGAGSQPYGFAGKVYLTGPYKGAPYGLSIVVPASAGLFDFGNVVTRASVGVGLYSGRAVVTATLPRIVQGVPLRLRGIEVTVNRPNFLFNPTSCGALATESQLSGFVPGSNALTEQSLASPFQVGECGRLAFTPKLTAATGARVSRVDGASLEVKVTQGAGTQPAGLGQSDIREVLASLPKKLAARITTLRKSCPAASFEAGPPPGGCSKEARVGSATVTTPVLPDPLTGPAYLVSHGGAAYPDLDVILGGDNGVEVVLVGHTHISSAGILSSSFESLPDVPISSFALSIPKALNSVLTDNRNGSLCGSHLVMPTTIVAQSGAKITQRTKIAVRNCPRHKKNTRRRHRRLKSHGHGHGKHRRSRKTRHGHRR